MADGEGNRQSRVSEPLPAVPDKLYFRIGEVARLLSLPTSVLRFWEGEFPHLRPYKGATGQRLYRRKDVEALREVRHLLYEQGYTIAGARQRLAERPAQGDPGNELHRTPTIAAGASGPASTAVLQQVYAELRDLSQLLGRPAEPVPGKTHASQLALRKRAAAYEGLPLPFEAVESKEP